MKAAISAIKRFFMILPAPFSHDEMEKNRFSEIFLGILVVVSGAQLLGSIINPLNNTSSTIATLIINFALCLLFTILLILILKKRKGDIFRFFTIILYALFCMFPLVSGDKGFSVLAWIISFPFISIVVLDFRKGLLASSLVAIALGWFMKGSSIETILQVTGSFTMVLVMSVLVGKHIYSIKQDNKLKELELSRLQMSQSRFMDLYTDVFEGNESSSHHKSNDNMYRNLVEVIADIFEKKGEFYIFYRKDLLATLQALPQPDAVLSYILLDGMSNINLFDGDSGKMENQLMNMGNYMFASCSVEDYFSKIDSVIELRSAKKRLEFNKIQTQINRVFPDKNGDETGESKLENMFDQFNISEREADIVRCILKGLTNKETSLELYISIETVKTHVKNILKKCGISSRIELIKLLSNSPLGF